MDWLICGERRYLQSSLFKNQKEIIHGFTGKCGGVSSGTITGLNLGFRVKDDKDSVMENYRLVAKDLGFSVEDAVLSRQTHTDHIRLVTQEDRGKGLVRESDIFDTDGLMTAERGIPLVVFTADCVPILLYDPEHSVIAAIHAGWRGTVQKIGAKGVGMMQEKFGSNPQKILAAIGPSIGPCHFSFGKEAAEYFPLEFCQEEGEGFLVDLWAMNRSQLLAEGVLEQNIEMGELCTVCHQDLFYSYRSHKEATGRQAAVIMLK